MALSFHGVEIQAKAKPDETAALTLFGEMCKRYEINERVGIYLVKEEAFRDLEDFLGSFREDTDFKSVVVDNCKKADDDASKLPFRTREGARLRDAWIQLNKIGKEAEDSLARGTALDDEEALLDPKDIVRLRAAFWDRYKVAFPSEHASADSLLSKRKKQIEAHLLQDPAISDVFKNKSLKHDRQAAKPKESDIGGEFKLVPKKAKSIEVDRARNIDNYFEGMWLEFHALAVAGLIPCDPLPLDPVTRVPVPETAATDPTDYVQIPWSTLLKVYYRAQLAAAKVPAAGRFEWVRARLDEERETGVTRHRVEKGYLGKIIEQTYQARANTWLYQPDRQLTSSSSRTTASLQSKVDKLQNQLTAALKKSHLKPGKGDKGGGKGKKGDKDKDLPPSVFPLPLGSQDPPKMSLLWEQNKESSTSQVYS